MIRYRYVLYVSLDFMQTVCYWLIVLALFNRRQRDNDAPVTLRAPARLWGTSCFLAGDTSHWKYGYRCFSGDQSAAACSTWKSQLPTKHCPPVHAATLARRLRSSFRGDADSLCPSAFSSYSEAVKMHKDLWKEFRALTVRPDRWHLLNHLPKPTFILMALLKPGAQGWNSNWATAPWPLDSRGPESSRLNVCQLLCADVIECAYRNMREWIT